MLAGLELGLRMNLSHAVGVFDRHMVRVYRTLGWAPIVLGSKDGISVGLWAFEAERRPRLLSRAGVSGDLARFWVQRGFGAAAAAQMPALAG
jgi:acyl homoserine lactone synthase